MPDDLKGNGHAPANAFAELRRLLVGPEREDLDDIRQRLDDPARVLKDLSRVLPEAIHLRSSDHKLRLALHPIIEESIRVSVQRDPRMLADALHPVIGKAVRKAVASALEGMLLSLNQIVEQSVSLRSMKWRLEAWRTGKSFGEILLLRSLLYRVEQVFLIHRKTGLALLHREASAVVAKDADVISGMLTAIQDFVRDSFDADEGDEWETVQMSGFSFWIQHAPQASLAGVVRGAAPKELRARFQENLERICLERAADLERFDGDATPFLACRPYLDACLLGQAPAKARRSILVWLLPALALLALGAWLFLAIRGHQRWENYVHKLSQQPGIVVTAAEKRGGQYLISGLRDPEEKDSAKLLAASGLPADRVRFDWQAYLSLKTKFATDRELAERQAALEHQALYFANNLSRITPEQLNAIGNVAAEMRALFRLADAAHKHVSTEILGHTDDSGSELRNTMLGQERAQQVLIALAADGVPSERLTARGVATSEPLRPGTSEPDRAVNRSVTFRITGLP